MKGLLLIFFLTTVAYAETGRVKEISGKVLVDADAEVTGAFTASTGTVQSFMVVGTDTNDNAPVGRYGENISSTSFAGVNVPTTSQYGDLASITLTAGDWDITYTVRWIGNGATWTQANSGVSTTAGNSSAGLTFGSNACLSQHASSATAIVQFPHTVAGVRTSLSATTTYYLKYLAVYSAGQPLATGRLTARRVR